MSRAPDRRSLRSKRLMRDALIRLLRQKAFSAITAQELVTQSLLGRSTFYAHCSGKEDLLLSSLQALRHELAAEHARRVACTKPGVRALYAADLVFGHVAGHRHVFPSLDRGRPADIVVREIALIVTDLIERDMAAAPWDSAIAPEWTVKMLSGALQELLLWWLRSDQSVPVSQLADAYRTLALRALTAGADCDSGHSLPAVPN